MNIKKITSNKKVQSFKNSKNFYESLNYAFSGLNYCLQNSSNFRIQIFCAFITILLGLLLKLSNFEKIVIFATIFSVLILEILNTSIESLVDLVVGNKFNDLCDQFRSPHLWFRDNDDWKLRHTVNQDGYDD